MKFWLTALLYLVSIGTQQIIASPPLPVPEPVNLETSWHKYFDNNENNLDASDQFINTLNKQKSQLNKDEQQNLKNDIDRLILKVQAFKQATQKEVILEELSPLFLTKYHLGDWLQIRRNIQKINRQLENLQENAEKTKNKTDLLKRSLDFLQVNYLISDNMTPKKLSIGLEMIETYLQIKIFEIELSANLKLQNFMNGNLAKLEEEKKVADKKLDLSNLSVEEHSQLLQQAIALYQEANQSLLKSEKEEIEDPEYITPLSSLQVLSDKISRALVQIEIIHQEVILQYAQMNTKFDEKQFEHYLIDWNMTLSQIFLRKQEWKELLTKNEIEAVTQRDTNVSTHEQSTSDNLYSLMSKAHNSLIFLDEKLLENKLLIEKIEELSVANHQPFHKKVMYVLKKIGQSISTISDSTSYTLFRINNSPVTIWTLLRSLGIFALTFFLANYMSKSIKNSQRIKQKIGKVNVFIIGKVSYYLIIGCGIFIGFFSLGFDLTNFVIIAGALGIGIGMGLQSIVNNFISGLIILFDRSLKVGDIVELDNGAEGKVITINIQNSQIRTFDGKDIIVPNSDLLSKRLVNLTMQDPYIRMKIPFSTSKENSLDHIQKLVTEVAMEMNYTVSDPKTCPKPKTCLREVGGDKNLLELVVWINLRNQVPREEMYHQYLSAIEKTILQHENNLSKSPQNFQLTGELNKVKPLDI
jgi:potassium-dependent mechanosensitive channel